MERSPTASAWTPEPELRGRFRTLTATTTRDLPVAGGLPARDDELRMSGLRYVSGHR